jgi:hypothetical protein
VGVEVNANGSDTVDIIIDDDDEQREKQRSLPTVTGTNPTGTDENDVRDDIANREGFTEEWEHV